VNTPPGDLTPEAFADAVVGAHKDRKATKVKVSVTDDAALRKGGFGGIIGVGQGSANPPRLVTLTYAPRGAKTHLALVGKGITYDSGGLSIKPSASMVTMKSDMAGAAAVVAATFAIAELGLPVKVTAIAPMAENMVSGSSTRPGDVLTMYGGRTVEVLNTDAEGRLVLADGLARSADDHPDLVVDVATLTGAATVALGRRTAGVMGNSESVAADVAAAMRDAGEPAWAMPLPEDLRKGLDSTVADMANVSGARDGGMLVAGLFLREFVPDGVAWAHLDIAGPAFNEKSAHGYTTAGGTGFAVPTLVELARELAG